MNRVTNFYNSFKFSAAALDLIKEEILKSEKYISETFVKNEKLEFLKKIEIKNVFYKYPQKKSLY